MNQLSWSPSEGRHRMNFGVASKTSECLWLTFRGCRCQEWGEVLLSKYNFWDHVLIRIWHWCSVSVICCWMRNHPVTLFCWLLFLILWSGVHVDGSLTQNGIIRAYLLGWTQLLSGPDWKIQESFPHMSDSSVLLSTVLSFLTCLAWASLAAWWASKREVSKLWRQKPQIS